MDFGILILLILVMLVIAFELFRGRYARPDPPHWGGDIWKHWR